MSLEKQEVRCEIRQQKGIFDMDYTANYQLPVWAETDRILRTDFNDMTEKLETALHLQNCRIYTASYQGTSTGITVLHLPGKPMFVVVFGASRRSILLAVRGANMGIIISPTQITTSDVVWEDDSVRVTGIDSGYRYDVCALLDMTA